MLRSALVSGAILPGACTNVSTVSATLTAIRWKRRPTRSAVVGSSSEGPAGPPRRPWPAADLRVGGWAVVVTAACSPPPHHDDDVPAGGLADAGDPGHPLGPFRVVAGTD